MDPTTLPLRDIHLPDPISWWPPATGWVVLAIVIVVGAAIAVCLYRRRINTWAERAALHELDAILAALRTDDDGHACAQALSRLTRRVALLYGGPEVCAAVGDVWLDAIRKLSSSVPLTASITQVLLIAPYSRSHAANITTADYRAAADHLRTWIHNASRVARQLKRQARHAAV
jgi:hypothetical protein